MSTPDPESMTMTAKVIAGLTTAAAPIIWLYTQLGKKADKHTVNNQFQKVESEMGRLRDTQAKIFDHLRDSDQRAQDRHDRLLERLSERKS